jgi:hypothetical protein
MPFPRTGTVQSSSRWPWIMLFSRVTLFIAVQATIALGYWLAGFSSAWESAANWWPFVVTITNFICVALLVRLFKQEGSRFWDIFRLQKEHLKSDLLVLLGVTIILGPVSYLPNIWLGGLLFGDPQIPLGLMLRPLPMWAAYASILLFPLTQGLAEGPTYFAYVMPKLEMQGMSRWLAVSLASLMLAFQHIAVPFLFDTRYLLWHGLMFIPFAFLFGILIRWRPRLLPYLAIIHVLMDVSFAAMLLGVAN